MMVSMAIVLQVEDYLSAYCSKCKAGSGAGEQSAA